MKKYCSMAAFFLALSLSLSLLVPGALAQEDESAAPAFSVTSPSAILMEGETGEVLYEKNADEQRFPASLTNMMTALLTVEAIEAGQLSLEDTITIPEGLTFDVLAGYSTLRSKVGEVFTVRDLLYAVLLTSPSDACNALAMAEAGDLPTFIDRMNDRASQLGMTGTHFVNAHGCQNEEHYTTARDVALLLREAITHPDFRDVTSTSTYIIPATEFSDMRELTNGNALVSNSVQGYRYRYAIGGKTGYTSKSGYCLASAAEKDHRIVVAVVLGGVNWIAQDEVVPNNYFVESRRLLEHGFNAFSKKAVLDQIDPIGTIPVSLSNQQDYVTVQPADSLWATLPHDLDPAIFDRKVDLPESLQAPVEKGAVLGSITVSYEGRTFGTVDLVASTGVERSQFLYALDRIRWVFGHLWVRLLLVAIVLLVLIFSLREKLFGPSPSRRGRQKGRKKQTYSTTYRGRNR